MKAKAVKAHENENEGANYRIDSIKKAEKALDEGDFVLGLPIFHKSYYKERYRPLCAF